METAKGAVEDDREPSETDDELPDLEAPLELLSSIAGRLLKGDIPTNPSRLQDLFDHIQSVVGDVVDASFAKITDAFDQVDEAHRHLAEEGEETEESQAYLAEFETGREHVEDGLAIMQETFFSAKNFNDLEEFEEEFREAEVQLAEGLGRIETAVIRAEDPELFNLIEVASSPHVEEALEVFSISLDLLSSHLEDGEASHLEKVLDQMEIAREHIENALDALEDEDEDEIQEEDSEAIAEAE